MFNLGRWLRQSFAEPCLSLKLFCSQTYILPKNRIFILVSFPWYFKYYSSHVLQCFVSVVLISHFKALCILGSHVLQCFVSMVLISHFKGFVHSWLYDSSSIICITFVWSVVWYNHCIWICHGQLLSLGFLLSWIGRPLGRCLI